MLLQQIVIGKIENSNKFSWLQNEPYDSLENEISITYTISTPNGFKNRASGKISISYILNIRLPTRVYLSL